MNEELQTNLNQLVVNEEFESFDQQFAPWVAAAVDSASPEQLREVLEFSQRMLTDIKGRRSHYEAAMEELEDSRRFLGPRDPASYSVSLVG